MKNIFCFSALIIAIFFLSCKTKEHSSPAKIFVNTSMLDSIKKQSDTQYSKRYPRTDFSTAEYYVNKKDTTNTQVMKDSLDRIRQIIIVKGDIKIYYAQYYPNGQLMAKYSLDTFGQFDGYCEEYYENGVVKSEGNYASGLHAGEWKNYDEKGNIISTSEYNKDGQQIKSQE